MLTAAFGIWFGSCVDHQGKRNAMPAIRDAEVSGFVLFLGIALTLAAFASRSYCRISAAYATGNPAS